MIGTSLASPGVGGHWRWRGIFATPSAARSGSPLGTVLCTQRTRPITVSFPSDATAFAHSKGVVHRDLKPANVMLGEFGEVVIMDWGESVALHDGAKASRLSNHNAICGTPAYMPPEVASQDVAQIGICTNVYLLGAILYEIVTGNQPHTGIDVKDCIRQAAANMIQPAPAKSGSWPSQ